MARLVHRLITTSILSITIAAFAALAGVTTPASAATFSSCVGAGFDISNNVSGATDCTISDDFDQDFLNTDPITVNTPPGFFNITTWVFGGKIGVDDGYDGTGSGQSGTYDITAAINSLGVDVLNILFIFKDGGDTTLVGYLVSTLTGDWATPFLEPPFSFPGNDPRDTSHISVYLNPVPVPAALPLFATGLGLYGIFAWRRRRKAATA